MPEECANDAQSKATATDAAWLMEGRAIRATLMNHLISIEATVETYWQVLSKNGNTYGIYLAAGALSALDAFAKEFHGCNWSTLERRSPDLFHGYTDRENKLII
jgi:hypothetical protein